MIYFNAFLVMCLFTGLMKLTEFFKRGGIKTWEDVIPDLILNCVIFSVCLISIFVQLIYNIKI